MDMYLSLEEFLYMEHRDVLLRYTVSHGQEIEFFNLIRGESISYKKYVELMNLALTYGHIHMADRMKLQIDGLYPPRSYCSIM